MHVSVVVHLPNTRQSATRHHVSHILRTGLQRTPETERDGADEDGDLATEPIAAETGHRGTAECTAGEDLVMKLARGARSKAKLGVRLRMYSPIQQHR